MGHDRIIALRNNKTVFRDGDKVLKVFDGSFKESEVLSEALNQARVEETGLPVPSVREVTLTDGRWTIVTEYIKGARSACGGAAAAARRVYLAAR